MALQLHTSPHPRFYSEDEVQVPGYRLPPPGLLLEDPLVSDLGLDLSTPDFGFDTEPSTTSEFFTSLIPSVPLPTLEGTDGYVQPQPEASTLHDSTAWEQDLGFGGLTPVEPLFQAALDLPPVRLAALSFELSDNQRDAETS